MSAPQIPNLRTLRGSLTSRGRGRGGGRGGGGHSAAPHALDASARKRHIIQSTDLDARDSRLSAVHAGYLEDAFATLFAPDLSRLPRRYPIINRGTYARTSALDHLILQFLSQYPDQPKQIVSLGAGSDTRYFRLLSQNPELQLVYHELDFPANTRPKIDVIEHTPALLSVIQGRSPGQKPPQKSEDGSSYTSTAFNIHGLDLLSLASPNAAGEPSEAAMSPPNVPNLSRTAPTLILSECCLCYSDHRDAEAIIKALQTSHIPAPTPLSFVLYEPIRPDDSFGRVMVSNLAARGIVLQTLQTYGSLSKQRQRLQEAGFVHGQGAADIDFVYERWISETEKERVAACEFLDEIEEWKLLAQHYCIAWGWRSGEGEGGDVFDKAWAAIEGQEDDVG